MDAWDVADTLISSDTVERNLETIAMLIKQKVPKTSLHDLGQKFILELLGGDYEVYYKSSETTENVDNPDYIKGFTIGMGT